MSMFGMSRVIAADAEEIVSNIPIGFTYGYQPSHHTIEMADGRIVVIDRPIPPGNALTERERREIIDSAIAEAKKAEEDFKQRLAESEEGFELILIASELPGPDKPAFFRRHREKIGAYIILSFVVYSILHIIGTALF